MLLVGIAAGLSTAIALTEMHLASSIDAQVRASIAAGRDVLRVSSASRAGIIPASDCARLDGQRGVIAAGGVGKAAIVSPASAPGTNITVVAAVGDALPVLAGGGATAPASPGWIVSSDLSSTLGLRKGSFLSIAGRTARVAATANLGARDQTQGGEILDPQAVTHTLVACYVEFGPGTFQAGEATIGFAFPGVQALDVQSILPTSGPAASPAEQWTGRSTRWAWIGGGLVAALVFLLAARSRRQEQAVYLITGSTRRIVAIIYLLEVGVLALVTACESVLWLAFIAVSEHADFEAFRTLVADVRTLLTMMAIVPIGLVWLVRADLLSTLRERGS